MITTTTRPAADARAVGRGSVGWAILGPGVIARDFLVGLRASETGRLVAVGSRSPARAETFAREQGAVSVHGSRGSVDVPDVWGSRTESGSRYVLRLVGEDPREVVVPTVQPMAAEIDAIGAALAAGRVEVPEMTWGESLLTARVLESWREAL